MTTIIRSNPQRFPLMKKSMKGIAGGGGSRKGHWLGKHGCSHQLTFPHHAESQTNVSSSYHFFFQLTTKTAKSATSLPAGSGKCFVPGAVLPLFVGISPIPIVPVQSWARSNACESKAVAMTCSKLLVGLTDESLVSKKRTIIF